MRSEKKIYRRINKRKREEIDIQKKKKCSEIQGERYEKLKREEIKDKDIFERHEYLMQNI